MLRGAWRSAWMELPSIYVNWHPIRSKWYSVPTTLHLSRLSISPDLVLDRQWWYPCCWVPSLCDCFKLLGCRTKYAESNSSSSVMPDTRNNVQSVCCFNHNQFSLPSNERWTRGSLKDLWLLLTLKRFWHLFACDWGPSRPRAFLILATLYFWSTAEFEVEKLRNEENAGGN